MSVQGVFLLFLSLSIAAILIFSQAAHATQAQTASAGPAHSHSLEDSNASSVGNTNGFIYTAVGIAVAFLSSVGLAVVIRRGHFL